MIILTRHKMYTYGNSLQRKSNTCQYSDTTPPPRRNLPRWSSRRAADLPAVAVVVGDPEQLTQGDDSKTTVEQSPCRSIFPGESGLLSLDAGLDLQEHDGKAQPWQRDGFSDSR